MDLIIDSQDKDIIDICTRYWSHNNGQFNESVKDILKSYNNLKGLNSIVEENCTAYSLITSCLTCGDKYIYKNRNDFKKIFNNEDDFIWECDDCIYFQTKQLEETQRNELVSSYKTAIQHPVMIEELTVKEAVVLRSLILHLATEDMEYLEYLDQVDGEISLSPFREYSLELLREMYRSSVISIHPYTSLNRINFTADLNFSFSLSEVPWLINIPEGMKMEEFSIALSNKISSLEYIEERPDEVIELCHEISLKECISYLEYLGDEYGFDFKVGPKTLEALNKVLTHFSVAQAYNFIWRACKDAAAYYQRSQVSKRQAANSIVGNIDRAIDQALANNWDVKAYKRRYDAPQSVISQVLFNHLLHTDDGGFNSKLKSLL
ncbi:MAG: hypothetical protein HWD86_01745 [Kangiellaceae bacterium]|nr:hypothetical protein [Kangiellaceae bacterium]